MNEQSKKAADDLAEAQAALTRAVPGLATEVQRETVRMLMLTIEHLRVDLLK